MAEKKEAQMLCVLTGKVVHGKGLGRTVGMPTANLQISGGQLPESGVYVTRITIGDRAYDSVTNIGMRPSVDQEEYTTVETYIFDFGDNIYDKDVILEVLKFLRPVQKFSGLQEVQEQVQIDMVEAEKYLKQM